LRIAAAAAATIDGAGAVVKCQDCMLSAVDIAHPHTHA
jgi:hypothetical protein